MGDGFKKTRILEILRGMFGSKENIFYICRRNHTHCTYRGIWEYFIFLMNYVILKNINIYEEKCIFDHYRYDSLSI